MPNAKRRTRRRRSMKKRIRNKTYRRKTYRRKTKVKRGGDLPRRQLVNKPEEAVKLFFSTGIGTPIIGIGLSNKNLNGIIGLDGSFFNSKSESFTVIYFISYTMQANLGWNWLLNFGLGFGNYNSEDGDKIGHTVFPIVSFEYVF